MVLWECVPEGDKALWAMVHDAVISIKLFLGKLLLLPHK